LANNRLPLATVEALAAVSASRPTVAAEPKELSDSSSLVCASVGETVMPVVGTVLAELVV